MICLQSHLLNASGYIIRRWICSGLVDVNCNSHYSTEQRMTIMKLDFFFNRRYAYVDYPALSLSAQT